MKATFNTTSNDIMLKFHLISSDVHRKSTHSSRKSSSKRLGNKLCKGLGGGFTLKYTLKSQKHPLCQATTSEKKATIAWKTTRSSPAVTPETAGARPSVVHLLQTNLPSFLCFQTGSASPPPLPAPGRPRERGRGPGRGRPPLRAPSARGPNGPSGRAARGGQGGPCGADNGARPAPPSPRRLRGAEGRGGRGDGGKAGGRRGAVPPAPAPWLRGEAGSRLPSLFGGGGGAAPSGPGGSRQLPHLPPPGTARPRDAPAAHPGGRGRRRLRPTRPGKAGRNRTPTAPARPEPPPRHHAPAPLRTCPPQDPQIHRPLGPSGPLDPRRPGAVPAIGVHARERGRGGHGGGAEPREGLCTVTVRGTDTLLPPDLTATGDNCSRRPHRRAFYIHRKPVPPPAFSLDGSNAVASSYWTAPCHSPACPASLSIPRRLASPLRAHW